MNTRTALQHRSESVVESAAHCLTTGGVVFLPTDTVFGLAALPTQKEAVARIFRLKARPSQKNLPVMVSSVDQIEAIGGQINDRVLSLVYSPYCPGPLSIAIGLDDKATPEWLWGRDELAFRIPNDHVLLSILDEVGPLLVTSANRSGSDTARTVEEAVAQLSEEPDLVVGGRECNCEPSTLVNCRFSKPVIERIGVVSPEDLAQYLT